jgi:HK97 family phage major capsid protein
MNKNLRELKARKAKHVAAMRKITDLAAKENRDLTPEEDQAFSTEQVAVTKLNAAIAREESLAQSEIEVGERTADDTVVTGAPAAAADLQGGFRSMGEFAIAVRQASLPGGSLDDRLVVGAAAPSTFGNEAGGADGGFLVPPAFADTVFQLSLEDDALLPYVDNIPVSGNGMVFPKDETTPWGTDGVRAFWQAEATAATQNKPIFGAQAMRLHKLMSLVPVSDELLDDSTALGAYLPPLMARSIGWKTSEAICFGTGVGQPYGAFTNTNIAVVVAKDGGQAANTVSALNLANMIARLPPGSYGRARWLITPDALPSVFTLTLGNYPIWMPPMGNVGGVQANPYGMLLGRPIQVSQHAAAFSAQGDICLADFQYVRAITKAGGIQVATSMHLFFDAGATAFRATFRIDAQPKISKQITQAKGTNKLSPFVMLGAR